MVDLQQQMMDMGRKARAASRILAGVDAGQRTAALLSVAAAIRADAEAILAANAQDLARGTAEGLAASMMDRLALNPERLEAIALSVEAIAHQPEVLGAEISRWQRPNGLDIARVRIPIGVIGIIYESRPNVTADAGALCLKSGNAVILRGGSDAFGSSSALVAAIGKGLTAAGLPADGVQLVATTDRAAVGHMLGGLDGQIDLIVPRGGKSLVARVQAEARVPVLAHLEGLCHTYVHAAADLGMAHDIVLNAKMRRTGICGATETLLVDAAVAGDFLPKAGADLVAKGCALRVDAAAADVLAAANIGYEAATEEDWCTEYLAPILAVKVVDGVDAAIDHIATYGSGHTDAIITADAKVAEAFLARVDSSIVLVNASTQFADGGEFGFGAEIGIGTGRLHARGPVGAEGLTTYKYLVRGTGQTRP